MGNIHLATLSEKLVSMPRAGKIALMVAADVIALPLCFLVAMLLRVGGIRAVMGYGYGPYILITLLSIAVFYFSGLYRAIIRFIDEHPLAITGGGLAVVIVLTYFLAIIVDDKRLPRTALVIYWFIAFTYVAGSRLSVRSFLRKNMGIGQNVKKRVAIFGAGEDGAQLAQSMRVAEKYIPICFFDEKRIFFKHSVAGLEVYSFVDAVEMIAKLGIELIVLAIPSAARQRRRQVLTMARKAGVPVKMLSSLMELSDGNIAEQIREVSIEDLLGRDMVPPQEALFGKCVHDQNVLVTGAGGSIGSELCRQILALAPRRLHLLDHSEFSLYVIEQELRARFPAMAIDAHLGSVCDAALVERIIQAGGIDTVYHAAAYKHVPLVEANMVEGIRNNVVGAQVISAAAEKFQVKTCVLISSDKAVRPTNVMGASKRIAELIFQAAAKTAPATTFCMVRFGNVLGSSGSVVPHFREQIKQGGPITITHPDITRYFMLIPEAAQLVIQAGAMATGGDVFVLDMGEPIKILDLARTMIDLAGLTEKNEENPDNEIEIKFVGLRPGEKLYEELILGKDAKLSEHPRIMWTTEYAIAPELLGKLLTALFEACETNDDAHIKDTLKTIVHGYAPQENGGVLMESGASRGVAANATEATILRIM